MVAMDGHPPSSEAFWQTHSPKVHLNGHSPNPSPALPLDTHPSNLPHGKKSLSGISLRAFVLGMLLGSSAILALLLASHHNSLWRAPYFAATLSAFHFLEFYITATYNTPAATTAAFLLSANGTAYNAAHALAFLETITSHWLFAYPSLLPAGTPRNTLLASGFASLVLGQVARSLAMAQAGTNFNHTVQMKKATDHTLVTDGIYAWLRHPSYFGFYWWGVGGQVVLGNWICCAGYAVILWRFFNRRIKRKSSLFFFFGSRRMPFFFFSGIGSVAEKEINKSYNGSLFANLNLVTKDEEKLLIEFFGQDYIDYRTRTGVGIPFIQ
jgi:protein-S-isoprenylcysteine O-methyltransferase